MNPQDSKDVWHYCHTLTTLIQEMGKDITIIKNRVQQIEYKLGKQKQTNLRKTYPFQSINPIMRAQNGGPRTTD